MCNNGHAIIRVLFMDIADGDRLKFEARSNISNTGGGARDLRFRPSAEFFPFFGRMFPGRETTLTRRRGASIEIEVLFGEARWEEGGAERRGTVRVWPPTDVRPNECRIAKISSLGLSGCIADDPNGGRSVFMMFQQADGTVRLYFTTETSLRNDDWDSRIKEFATDWLGGDDKASFLDLEIGVQFPHD